jgi:hypothetical protein
MIPTVYCGKDYRDWPWWAFWKVGHREHEHLTSTRGYANTVFEERAWCPGHETLGGGEP